jgi:hypothetical protein
MATAPPISPTATSARPTTAIRAGGLRQDYGGVNL